MRVATEAAEAAALRASTASLRADVKRRHGANKSKKKLRLGSAHQRQLGSAHQGDSGSTGFKGQGAASVSAGRGGEGDEGVARSLGGGGIEEVEGLLGDLDV